MASDVITDAYPNREEMFHGRAVWAMGEDGDEGWLIAGHGARALAAANAFGRYLDGKRWSAHLTLTVRETWKLVVDTCGCTEDEHAAHAVHEDPGMPWYDCDSCEYWGLPPCRDNYGWSTVPAEPDTVGALAFTEVSW